MGFDGRFCRFAIKDLHCMGRYGIILPEWQPRQQEKQGDTAEQ